MSQFAKAVLSATLLSSLPFALHAAQAPAPPPAAQSVDRAISKVYPALVQIRVLTVDHGSGRARKFEASGSGVIISPEGYVVTNHHVAGRAVSMRVTLSTKEELEATLVGTDPLSDIAVLKLDLSSRRAGAPPLPSAAWGNSSALKIGDTVLAMGCPLALSQSVTEGIVANKDMMLPRMFSGRFMLDGEDVGSLVKWIGHDAAIQPGNSGGPLVDTAGDVVGINEIGLGSMSGAIPSDLAKAVAAELIAKGKVKRAWIGADFQPLLKEAAQSPDAKGILVAGVIAGSPAEEAGLRAGDIVLALDGAPVAARFREELPAFNLLL
ncbi:MAG: trypsin-like peptidase domain-containing protein, partial [Deltaproteobacteria bacterium]|nr:trypsin-like peptidase domain-containing protein [Deltaproteobacteria bacterium]